MNIDIQVYDEVNRKQFMSYIIDWCNSYHNWTYTHSTYRSWNGVLPVDNVIWNSWWCEETINLKPFTHHFRHIPVCVPLFLVVFGSCTLFSSFNNCLKYETLFSDVENIIWTVEFEMFLRVARKHSRKCSRNF